MSRTRTCRFHCAGCARHFTSLAAFDAHRVGDFQTGRTCSHPELVRRRDGGPGLAPVAGACRIGGPHQSGERVTLWERTADQGAGERLRAVAEALGTIRGPVGASAPPLTPAGP